ncbi:hypothetical protein NFI96_009544 [Prochilodus magdalenae]|nr:hypothetical protein NFI96_009544 [Prochilodus magdalenae]
MDSWGQVIPSGVGLQVVMVLEASEGTAVCGVETPGATTGHALLQTSRAADPHDGGISSSGTRGKRRRVTLLSPEARSTKKRKTTDCASRKKLKGVTGRTITTTQHLEKPQPELATTTHEMVLKRVSTKRLLRLLGEFLCRRCHLLKDLTPAHPLRWIHVVDDFLLFSGYQLDLFITPGSVVFLYMLCRDIVSPEVSSMKELQVLVLTCLYVAYAYIGHELSYPAMAFIAEENRDAFWRRTWAITWHMSGKMLKISNDPEFFKDVFTDLKTAADH